MAIPTYQGIESGSAVLLYADSPTDVSANETIEKVDNAGGYTATDTAMVVDDASTLCPDVVDTGTGTIADPPVCNVLCVVRTGEIMVCYSRVDSTETINVIRGVGKIPELASFTDNQFNAALVDDDDIQLMGSVTFPSLTNLIVTNGDVTLNGTQGMFKTRDNYLGYDTAFTSEPPNVELTCTLPRNTLPAYRRLLDMSIQTDGNSPARYIEQLGAAPAGLELPKKLIIVVPVTDYKSKPSVTISGSDYFDLAKSIIIPNAYISTEITKAYSEGAQTELAVTISGGRCPVFRTVGWMGAFEDLCRIMPTV